MTFEKSAGNSLTVIKLDLENKETWRYKGHVLARDDRSITLEAFFDREDMHFHGIFLGKGDRFVETYYTDRWYNIFEIHARDNDRRDTLGDRVVESGRYQHREQSSS